MTSLSGGISSSSVCLSEEAFLGDHIESFVFLSGITLYLSVSTWFILNGTRRGVPRIYTRPLLVWCADSSWKGNKFGAQNDKETP